MTTAPALDDLMEPEKAEFEVSYGETVVLTCAEHRGWETSGVFALADALDAWKTHYEEAHRR